MASPLFATQMAKDREKDIPVSVKSSSSSLSDVRSASLWVGVGFSDVKCSSSTSVSLTIVKDFFLPCRVIDGEKGNKRKR